MGLSLGATCSKGPDLNSRSGSQEQDAALRQAQGLLDSGRYDEAIAAYMRFETDWPRSPKIPLMLARRGECYYKKGDYERAARDFQALLAQYPKSPEAAQAAWGLALDAYRNNDCRQVDKLVMQYRGLAIDNTWDRLTLLLAECKRSGDKSRAFFLYGEEARDGKDPQLRDQARAKAESLAAELSADELENAAAEHPHEFPGDLALLTRARMALAANQADPASAFLKQLAAGYPDSSYAKGLEDLTATVAYRGKVKPSRIGVLVPSSGKFAGYGDRALKGIMLAGNVFNEGSPLEAADLIIRDTGAGDEQVDQVIADLVDKDSVIAIVGPLRTSTALRAGAKAQELGVPIVTLAPGEKITEVGDIVYQNCLTKSIQAEALADYAVNGMGLAGVGILAPGDDYGREFADLFRREVIAAGGKIVASQSYNMSSTDFRGEIGAIKNQGGDKLQALFIPDSWEKAAMIAPQLRFYQLTGLKLLGANAWHDDRLIQKTQAEDIAGAVFTDSYAPEQNLPAFNEFNRRFQNAFSEKPDLVAAQAYETVDVILRLIDEYHVRDREQMKKALDHLERYPGVLGPITLDASRRWRKPIYLLGPAEGTFHVVSTYER